MVALHEQMAILAESLRQQQFGGGGSAGAVDAVTLSTASQAITMPASPTVGDVLTLVVTAAGGTPAWDAAITWDAASAPSLSAVAGERDVLTFLYTGTDWLGFVSGLFAPIPDIIVPSTPTSLSATATSATVIDLTWTASTDNIGVTGYEYRIDGGAAVDAGVGTSESVTGLTASTLYSFEVRAYDAAGNRSGWSTPDSATTDAEVVVLSHEFRNSYVSTADTATYTFTAADLGVATEARRIIVGIGWRAASGASLTSVTVGGVSATVDVSNPVSINGGISGAAVVHAAVPTGTTGDIVVTLSSAAVRAGIGVWRATGPVTAADTDAPLTGVGTGTINGVAGGFVIATAFSTGVTTWTGVTEDYDHATGETDYYATGGSTTNTGAITWGTSKTTTAMGLAQAAVAYEGV